MPSAPRVPCRAPRCSELIRSGTGGYCAAHQSLALKTVILTLASGDTVRRMLSASELRWREKGQVYRTGRWRALRLAKIKANPICEYCNQAITAEVDHVKPIEDGGDPWSWNNLRSACKPCHSHKTATVDVPARAKKSGKRVGGPKSLGPHRLYIACP